MSLVANLKKNDKKGLFSFTNAYSNYSTGFLPLDYINALKTRYVGEDGKEHVEILPGVMSGKFITIIGASGGGKSTIARQIAWNIVKGYENGLVICADTEHADYVDRIYDITDMAHDDPRYILNDEDSYVESVFAQINEIADEKERMGADAMEKVSSIRACKSSRNIYAPTVVIIDALPTFSSKNLKTDEVEKGTLGMRETQLITQFYNKMVGLCAKYNIIIIAVNHIRPKPKLDLYAPETRQLMMLRSGEYLPRGETPVYLASTVFRMNPSASKSKAFTVEEYGFDGFLCTVQVAKSKTNFIGGEVNLVFREDKGYDPVYSLYQFASDCGAIEGRNPYLRIKGADDFKFSKSNFGDQFEKDEKFRAAVLSALKPYLESIAGCKETDDVISNISMDKLLVMNEDGELEASGVKELQNGKVIIKQ